MKLYATRKLMMAVQFYLRTPYLYGKVINQTSNPGRTNARTYTTMPR